MGSWLSMVHGHHQSPTYMKIPTKIQSSPAAHIDKYQSIVNFHEEHIENGLIFQPSNYHLLQKLFHHIFLPIFWISKFEWKLDIPVFSPSTKMKLPFPPFINCCINYRHWRYFRVLFVLQQRQSYISIPKNDCSRPPSRYLVLSTRTQG